MESAGEFRHHAVASLCGSLQPEHPDGVSLRGRSSGGDDGENPLLTPNVGRIYIGMDDYFSDTNRNFIGLIDDVRIYNFALAPSDLAGIKQQP